MTTSLDRKYKINQENRDWEFAVNSHARYLKLLRMSVQFPDIHRRTQENINRLENQFPQLKRKKI